MLHAESREQSFDVSHLTRFPYFTVWPLQEGQAFQAMYEQAGILSSEDGTVSVMAGSTLGGGTRINWCASFKTPPHVRWAWGVL